MKIRVAMTLGDPAGIGPEIVFKALRDPRVRRVCEPIVMNHDAWTALKRTVRPGHPSKKGGAFAIQSLTLGVSSVRSGHAQALVTAPVSKESFRLAHHGFPGHTEWLASVCRTPDAAMLMVSGPLRAILLTRHVPLSQVTRHLNPALIQRSAELGNAFCRLHLGRARPRLVACGVNPHAGDHGIIGTEEKTLYAPALRALRKKGIHVAGPLPSDSVFAQMSKDRYDLALAAYHDQGMIPLKVYAPHRVVNVTLGLPFLRTSPGHGTAYDIAGRQRADARPMIEAILLAAAYAKRDPAFGAA